MAERRMMAKSVIETDLFLDMPMSAQCLYFHLLLRADDDGFIKNPSSIRREINASNDDMKLLIAKQYILPFESGVIVIRHWKIHNYIRKDRYRQTDCAELSMIELEPTQNVYKIKDKTTTKSEVGDVWYTSGIPCDNQLSPSGKDRIELGKDRVDAAASRATRVANSVPILDKNTIEEKNTSCCNAAAAPADTSLSAVITAFCDNLQPFAGNLVLEQLTDAYDRYGEKWCLAAIAEAAKNGGRSLNYVIRILERWERDGFQSSPQRNGRKNTSANELYTAALAQLENNGGGLI